MQIGIPAKLAPVLFAQALSRLFLVYSAYSVIFAEVLLLLAGWSEANAAVLWAGFLVGFPGFVLWWLMFSPLSPFSASLYLVFLGGCLVIATWAVMATMPEVVTTKFLPFTLLGFALITTCGVAARVRDRLLWATLGYVIANVAIFIGAQLARAPFEFDVRLLSGYLIVVLAISVTPGMLRSQSKIQPSLDNSHDFIAQDAVVSASAKDIAAHLHDTLLANLALISQTKPGMLQQDVRESIEAQLARFENVELSTTLLARQSHQLSSSNSERLTPISTALEQAETNGLAINVSGELTSLERLTDDQIAATAAALTQCLANVLAHSGQKQAEVVFLGIPTHVSVTIIDGGVGFDIDAIPEDRLGLKLSVRERIEKAGGSVRIWSNPGQGAAIMLQFQQGGEQ
jgi:signal transduction histidine kinase